jgi:hypothetical protein
MLDLQQIAADNCTLVVSDRLQALCGHYVLFAIHCYNTFLQSNGTINQRGLASLLCPLACVLGTLPNQEPFENQRECPFLINLEPTLKDF